MTRSSFARFFPLAVVTVSAAAAAAGCSSSNASDGTSPAAGSDSGVVSTTSADDQLPPTGQTSVEAWLKTGVYKTWHCEAAVHAARSPSPHGFNRICSNDAIASTSSSTATWPMGAAAVKELYDAATDTTPSGYAVYRKDSAESAEGASWYWYERVPSSSGAPHDANGVVADGFGTADAGPPNTICVGCHMAAGSDSAHTPSTGSRDFVYTPVTN